MKGKTKGKVTKKTGNIDNIMKNFGGDMDDPMDNFEKNFNPEKQFDIPIYNNIDSEFDKFSKMFGGDDDVDLSSLKDKNSKKQSEEDKLLAAILGGQPQSNKKKKDNDLDELTKALKLAEDNKNKKYGKQDNDAEILKGIFAGTGGTGGKKKKDDDDLASILNAADKNLQNKNKGEMDFLKKFLTKEEISQAEQEGDGGKKPKKGGNIPTKNAIINDDLYPAFQEKIFHNITKMKSVKVLEKEIKLCKGIVEFKKNQKMDYKDWEAKIQQAQKLYDEIESNLKSGKMSKDDYNKSITEELKYEQKLIDVYIPKDEKSTKPQKDQIIKRVNIRIKTINQELENPVGTEQEIPKQQEIKSSVEEKPSIPQANPEAEKAKVYVDLLLQQYLSARDYFKQNELKINQEDCNTKCKEIVLAKKKLQSGDSNGVNLQELPKSIKPEYIYGCSTEERDNKFNQILSDLLKQRKEIEAHKASYMEKIKKLNKEDFAKMKSQVRDALNTYKVKLEKLTNDLKNLLEKKKDKWAPAPEISVEEEKTENGTKKVMKVKKIYPPFNPKSATVPGAENPPSNVPKNTNQNLNQSSNNSKMKINVDDLNKELDAQLNEVQSKQTQPQTQPQPQGKVEQNTLKQEDIDDFNNIDKINSLKVLEYELKKIEDQMAQISGMTPKDMRMKKVKISCKIKSMQAQMGEGQITPQDYYGFLNQQVLKEKSLLNYFKEKKEIDKAKIVANRMNLMIEEIKELKEFIK